MQYMFKSGTPRTTWSVGIGLNATIAPVVLAAVDLHIVSGSAERNRSHEDCQIRGAGVRTLRTLRSLQACVFWFLAVG
ncbi:hypothetical protein EI94DRAFT_785070 [Lactarius quietus]|nr:hypothetical protein EI94DRAFT_785070 [Lactarius quietus]